MNTVLRLAVALLPRAMRDRYREQWAADTRDAREAGLSPSGISWGALVFAITAPRPWPTLSWDPTRARRIAFAFALTGALLGVTRYPAALEFDLRPPQALALVASVTETITSGLQVVGPIVAVVLIAAARRVRTRERAAIVVLAIAAVAPLVAPELARNAMDIYRNPGTLAFAAAAVLIVAAVVLRDGGRELAAASPRVIAGCASLVLVVGVVGWVSASGMWFGRTPLVTAEPVGSTLYEIWLQVKLEFEAEVDFVLASGVFAVLVAVGTVVLAGILRGAPGLKVATITSVFLLVWGYILMSQYFALALPSPGIAAASPLLLTALRFAIVATIFVAVDGIRGPGWVRRPAVGRP